MWHVYLHGSVVRLAADHRKYQSLGGYWLEKRTLRRWLNLIAGGETSVSSFLTPTGGMHLKILTKTNEPKELVLYQWPRRDSWCSLVHIQFVVSWFFFGQLEFGSGCRIRYSRQSVRSDCGSQNVSHIHRDVGKMLISSACIHNLRANNASTSLNNG